MMLGQVSDPSAAREIARDSWWFRSNESDPACGTTADQGLACACIAPSPGGSLARDVQHRLLPFAACAKEALERCPVLRDGEPRAGGGVELRAEGLGGEDEVEEVGPRRAIRVVHLRSVGPATNASAGPRAKHATPVFQGSRSSHYQFAPAPVADAVRE